MKIEGKSDLSISFHLKVIGRFKNKLILVLILTLMDTFLSSLGIGMILPVFKALLNPLHKNELISKFLPFIDGMQPGSRLALVAGVTVLVFLIKAVISMWTAIASNEFLQKLRFNWVGIIGEHYLQAPLLRISGRKQGDLLNDWFNETLAASRFYKSSLTYLSSSSIAIALLVLGLIVNWQTMISMISIGAVAVLLIRGLTYQRSASLSKAKLRVNQALNSAMVENIANVRDLKLMAAEKIRLLHINELSSQLKSIFVRGAVLSEVPRVSGELLAVIFLMGFILVSIVTLKMSPVGVLPMIAFFFLAFYRLVTASSIAMASRIKALNDLHSVRRIFELLIEKEREEDLAAGTHLMKINGDIRFRNILFKYKANAENFDIKAKDVCIPKGKLTLLVGPSGSGKSTMLDLLMRLMEPNSGTIEVDGASAAEYCLKDWRSCFGYVSQDAALFNGSIRMNLCLAKPNASDAEIKKACRTAGADEFISFLPMGYDTVIGDRGFSLSGGQRKRLAIARAIIREPSILILDEATTSFEQSLERKLLKRLNEAFPDLTIIIVTHRIQNTNGVDWVIVLEKGHVVACGTEQDVAIGNYG